MKSKKIIALAKGVWAFCSYLFVPQRGKSSKNESQLDIIEHEKM